MNPLAIFGASALLSLVSSVVIAQLYVWPRLQVISREQALVALTAPHMFRFVGLSFLIPGVVSPSLPAAFAVPAGYGDLVAAMLAIIAIMLVTMHSSWGIATVWLFNIWGAIDLVFAIYQGLHLGIDPGALGAAYFIPTAIVPPLLTLHVLIFRVLTRAS